MVRLYTHTMESATDMNGNESQKGLTGIREYWECNDGVAKLPLCGLCIIPRSFQFTKCCSLLYKH